MARAAVLAFAALIVLLPLGRLPVWDDNEARYLVLARDILEHGRWLIPELRGEPYIMKPQLFFWSIALASLPGGHVTELTGMLPAALSAIATVAGVLAIGARIWGRTVGVVAALVLTTMVGFVVVSHRAQPDVMVTAWATWALYWLLVARRADWAPGPVLGFWACVAGAAMTKGPPGFVALAAALIAVAATDGLGALRRLRPLAGLPLLLALTSPWWLTYLARQPGAVMQRAVAGEYAVWLAKRGLEARLEIFALVGYVLPWLTFLVAAAFWWRHVAPDGVRRLVGWWALGTWLLIGLSGVQRVRYLMPVYPALALLVAEFVVRARDARGQALLHRATLAACALAFAGAVLVLTPWLARLEGHGRPWVPTTWGEAVLIAALLAVASVGAWLAARQRAFVGAAVTIVLGVGAVLIDEGVRYPARFARDFDVRPLAAAAGRLTSPGATVPSLGTMWLSYDFYLGRRVVEVDRDAIVRVLASPPAGAVLMSPRAWRELRGGASREWRVIAARDGARPAVVIGPPER